jgi:hypothetical protein
MNYNDELRRLTTKLFAELKIGIPAIFKILSYLIQTLLCAGAVVAIAIYGLLNKMADEMEKGQKGQSGQKKQQPPSKKKDDTIWEVPVVITEKCPFGITKYCTQKCHYWTRTFDGGGFCRKVQKKEGW